MSSITRTMKDGTKIITEWPPKCKFGEEVHKIMMTDGRIIVIDEAKKNELLEMG